MQHTVQHTESSMQHSMTERAACKEPRVCCHCLLRCKLRRAAIYLLKLSLRLGIPNTTKYEDRNRHIPAVTVYRGGLPTLLKV